MRGHHPSAIQRRKLGRAQTGLTPPRYISSNISISAKLSGTEEGTEMTIIRAQRLTTFSVAADGSSVSLGVADEEGRTGALILQHHDPSLRLVYRAAGWDVERSTVPETFIVTLRTVDGFHVSFALTAADLSDMANATPKPTLDADQRPPKLRSVH